MGGWTRTYASTQKSGLLELSVASYILRGVSFATFSSGRACPSTDYSLVLPAQNAMRCADQLRPYSPRETLTG